jgi:RND family efflux transporter MFP subunit
MNNKKIRIIVIVMAVIAAGFWFYQRQASKKPDKKDFLLRVPVSVATLNTSSVRDSFSVVGVSEAFRDVEIYSETVGLVRKVHVDVGQKKSAGEVLLKVDDELQASVWRKARANFEQAKRDFERYRNLQREGAVALSSYEAVKLRLEDAEAEMIAARRKYNDTGIKAPINGMVTSRLVDVGEMVQPGMKVANMIDLSKVKIRMNVPEKLIVRLSEGLPASVTSDIYPGKLFEGRIATISGKARRDHTYEVEVIMDNPAGSPFRGGMFARVAFVDSDMHKALLLPRTALTGSIKEPQVFVVKNNIARSKTIVIGQELEQYLEVLEGLSPGDSVVTNGQNELNDGMPVSVIRQISPTGS